MTTLPPGLPVLSMPEIPTREHDRAGSGGVVFTPGHHFSPGGADPAVPMIRGFTIDEDHLFFGYFVWRRDGNKRHWRLCEQNTRLLYARRGDQLSRDCIEFYISWFDHEWARGRNLEKSGAPTE